MTMETFLARLKEKPVDEVLYLQSQNDNLHAELQELIEDATPDIPFASQVFGSLPDVANVWIGDERSVTSLHKGILH
jgi:jumonji domain-containing protein 7